MPYVSHVTNALQDPPEDAVVTVCGHVFCNQCICEHMIGNESQCPTKNCKTRLSVSDIYSITVLRDAVSNNPITRALNCSVSEPAKVSVAHSSSYPEGSSKIKAALKLLTALRRPHDTAATLSVLRGCVSVVKNETPDIESVVRNETPDIKSVVKNENQGIEYVVKNETPDFTCFSQSSVKVSGEKAIVFSQWTKMLDLLEDHLKESSIKYCRLDGTMSLADRDKAVKDFTNMPEVCLSFWRDVRLVRICNFQVMLNS